MQNDELWTVYTIKKDGTKVNVLYIFDQNHQKSVIAVDHSRNFKGIVVDGGYNGEIGIYPGRGNYCLKLKKRNLKNKKLSKILTYTR